MKKFLFLLATACCIYSSASAQYVSAGEYFSTAKCSPCDNVFSWGANWDGELGDSTLADRNEPGIVHNLSGVTSVSAGGYFTLALRNDSTVWAWGANWDGYMGDGTFIDRLEPVKTIGLGSVKAIAAGTYHSLALKRDGTVWAWGYNGYGELGDSTTTTRTSPVLVKGLTGVIAIAAGEYHSLALKSDGTVWSWGWNSNGQLGDSTTLQKIYRVQVKDITGVTKISAGYSFSLALKSDGTLWAWGENGSGQLGDGTTVQKIYRVQVSVLGNTVIAMDGGEDFALAIKNDNTVWGWGYNGYGQLGDNTYTQRTAPVQTLGGMANAISISAGGNHSLAMKSDGSVWAWGYNYEGQTGNGIDNNEYTLPQRTLYLCPAQDTDIDIDLLAACSSFDTISSGGSDLTQITVHNYGCDTLLISSVTSTSSTFTISSFPTVIAPLDSAQMNVTFVPVAPGTYSATITVFNNDADTAFCLWGVATPAPSVTVTPTAFTATITCGDSIINILNIGNTGAGNLNYSVSPCNFNSSLGSVLSKLNLNFATINSAIPSRFNFTDGIVGTNISDGGSDMYDGGNYINTNLGTSLAYSDNLVISSAAMGSGGQYFTRKYQGLWVFGADVNAINYFEITGNNGADGDGNTDNTILTTSRCGITYRGFVKRIYNAGDPSINHLIIVEDKPGLSHTAASNTNDDQHRISGLNTTTRIYYLLYARTAGGYIDNAATLNIMNKFLDAINQFPSWLIVGPTTTGTVVPSGTNTVSVEMDGTGLVVGQYTSTINVNSNDPLNPSVAITCSLAVAGTPNLNVSVYDLTPPCVKFDSIMAYTTSRDSILLTNTGCDTLRIDSLKISPSLFTILSSPVKVAPGDSKKVVMQFAPIAAGTFAGTLNIYTNELDTAVCLQGKAFPRPIISVLPTSLSTTLACTSSYTSTVTISNTGGNNLIYNFNTSNLPIAASCTPTIGAKNNCCLMGIYNVAFNTINNTTLATNGRYNDYTSTQSTIVNPGQTYTLSVQTGVSYNEYVEAWIDYNDNGIFEGGELVMNVLNVLPNQTHTVSVTIPGSAVKNKALRMRVSSDSDGSPIPTPCSNAVYGQTEDYTVKVLNWLTLPVPSGTVTPSSSNTVSVVFNSANLTVGTYTSTISISNNDPLNNPLLVSCTLTVVGTPDLNVSIYDLTPPCVKFDSIMAYTTSKDSILLTNAGCDTLRIDSLKISPSLFTILSSPVKVAPGDSKKVVMQFAPIAAGTFAGTLNIYTNELDTAVCLQGKAFPRPIISVLPTSLSTTLACASSSTSTVTISNTGGSNLIYNINILNPILLSSFPIAASCTPTIGAKNNCCDMGIYNMAFNTINNTTLATDGRYNDYTSTQSTIVNPGQTYTLSVQTGASYNEYVEAWIDYNDNGIFEGGELVMNVLNVLPNQTHTISVTIPGSAVKNKALRMRVSSDYSSSPVPTPCSNAVYGQTEDYTVKILNWLTLPVPSGTVTPSSSNTVSVVFNSANLTVGTYTSTISISSNDPLNNPISVPCTLTVVGTPDLNVSIYDLTPPCVKFDSIMAYTTSRDSILLTNAGCDTLRIDSLKISPSLFTILSSPVKVAPGSSKKVVMQFAPIAAGTFAGTLNIYTNELDTAVCLLGKAFPRPIISVLPTSLSTTLGCASSYTNTVTISNTGGSNLTYNINILNPTLFSSLPIAASCTPTIGAKNNCCDMGIYNVAFNTINNTTLATNGRYNDYTSTQSTIVNPGQTYTLSVQTGVSYNEYVEAWIDYNDNGIFEGGELVMNVLNVLPNQTHTISVTIPGSAVKNKALRMRVSSDYDGSPIPTPCSNAVYGQTEDYTIKVLDWVVLTAPSGTITPSSSNTFTVTLNSGNLTAGTYTANVSISNNDPLNNPLSVPYTLTVVGVADARFALMDTVPTLCLDLDSIMEYTTSMDSVRIYNTGCDTLDIDSLRITPAVFSLVSAPPSVAPGQTRYVAVRFSPLSAGSFAGTLTVYTNDADTVICLKGKSFPKPVQCHNPNSFAPHFLVCQDSILDTLVMCNTGAGTLNYRLWSPYGRSAAFDGSGDYISTPLNMDQGVGSPGLTMSAWVYPTSLAGGYHHVISTDNGGYDWSMLKIGSLWYVFTGENVRSTGLSVTLNQWQHIAAVFIPGFGIKFYKNGVLANVPFIDYDASDNNLRIGSNPGFGEYFDGKIDEARAYNKQLTQAEIIASMRNSLTGTENGLQGYWHFDDSTATDFSPNTNDGTLSGNAFITIPNVQFVPSPNGTVAPSGTYSVQVKFKKAGLPTGTSIIPIYLNSNDPLNALDTINATFDIDAAPATPIAGSNSPICSGNNLSLTASTITGAIYAWTGPNSFTSALQNPVIVGATTAASGTYSVTAAVSGCPAGAAGTTTVVVNAPPATPTAGSNSPVCSGQVLSLTASTISGATYAWTGPNSFSSSLQNPTISGVTTAASGTYSVTATVPGCPPTTATTTTVTINQTPVAPAASSNSPVCVGNDLSLTASTITGVTYAWTGPNSLSSATQNPVITGATVAASGTYSVTATQNGCTGPIGTTSVIINPQPGAPIAGSNSTVCSGLTLSLTANTTSGATYAWTGPNSFTAATQNPTIPGVTTLAAGTYSVTATVGGCPTSPVGTTTVAINQTPIAPSAGSNSPVCVGNNVSLTANTITGVTYAWTGPNSFTSVLQDPVIIGATVAASGTYSVTATIGGCTGPRGTTTVTVNPPPGAPTAGSNSTVCSGQTLSLTANTISGATYAWTGPNSFSAGSQNPTIPSVTTLAAGTYSVTATVGGCPTSPVGTTTVAINQSPDAPVASSNSPVCSGQTLSLSASTAAGATYSWSGPLGYTSVFQDPTIAAVPTTRAGTYSVVAIVDGCPSTAGTTSVTIYQTPAAPSAGSNSPVCVGFTISLTANTISGATYAWTGPNSFSDASQNPTISGAGTINSGSYSVTVTVNGCTGAVGTTSVTVNDTPSSPSAGSNTPVCSGQTLSLNATTVTGATYSWTGPNSFSSSSQNPTIGSVTTLAGGTYSVSAVVGGCPPSAPGTVAVTINQTPAAPVAASNSPVCVGSTLSLTASTITGATYAWTGPNSFTDATQDPAISSVGTVNAGTYSVSATVNGCTGPIGTTAVVVNTIPAAPIAGSNSTVCSGQILSLTASTISGVTYSWTGPNSFTSSSQNPSIAGVTTAANGTYSVIATLGACPPSSAGTTVATINQTPSAPIASSNSPVCTGVTLSLTASSEGTTYSWNGPAGFISSSQNPTLASVTTANSGTYSVSATMLGCTGPEGTTSVVVNTIPIAPTASNKSACFGSTIPDLTAAGSNIQWYDNLGAFAFNGSPFATGQTAVGTYTYTATQTVNGCTSPSATVTLTINALPAAPNAGSDVSICYGNPTPDLTASGANIKWYNHIGASVGTGSPFATGVTAPGTYTFIATQTNTVTTCESLGDTVFLMINSTAPPVAPDVAVCAGSSVPPLVATGTNIEWYDAAQVPVFSGSTFNTGQTAVGTYTYYVTQTNTVTGCPSVKDTVLLIISTQPGSPPVVADKNACFGAVIPNLAATTGTIINWYSDALLTNHVYTGNPYATGLTGVGSYTFFATDSTSGCPEGPSEPVVLLINPLPATLSVNDTASCFGSNTPALITSGTNIQWYNSLAAVVSVNDTFATGQTAAGTYTYYVTQSNSGTGCESLKDTVHLTINSLPAMVSALDTIVCSAATIPNLTSTGTNVQWYDSTGTFVFTGNSYATGLTAQGVYGYLVTQKDGITGCESVADTAVLAILLSPPVPIANNVAVCVGSPIPPLTATGVNPHWYSNAALTNLVTTGNTYNTGQTAVGVYTYYVKDTLSGCVSSSADSVSLIISTPPSKPTAANATVCYGAPSLLTATGANPQWYTDAALINMVGTGNSFNTGLSSVGTYTYYVTDFTAGCGNSVSDTAVITINPSPLVTASTYTTTIAQGASTNLSAYNAVTYAWAPPAGLSATTGANVVASPTVTTTYTVTGTNSYGCSNSVNIHIIVNPLGVSSFANPVQDVNIYPNPAIGSFTLEFNTTMETPIDIYMINMLGERVRVMHSEASNGRGLMQHKYKIDTGTLTEGVYNVEIVTEKGSLNRRVVLFR